MTPSFKRKPFVLETSPSSVVHRFWSKTKSWNMKRQRTFSVVLLEPCFFCCSRVIYFRPAYALPTPLRCFPTRGLFVLICLCVPTLTSCFLILPTRLACVASVGFLVVLILHILPMRWAPVLSVEVVFFVLLISQQQNTTCNITTKHFLQHRLRRKKYYITNILKMPTESLRAQAKCLRQHFTRHTLYKLNLPTKKTLLTWRSIGSSEKQQY